MAQVHAGLSKLAWRFALEQWAERTAWTALAKLSRVKTSLMSVVLLPDPSQKAFPLPVPASRVALVVRDLVAKYLRISYHQMA